MRREIPEIDIEGTPGYARLIGHNFDSIQECYDLFMPPYTAKRLDRAQRAANEKFDGQQAETVKFGAEDMQVWCGGATGGIKWVLENDDFQLFFCTPVTKNGEPRRWAVQARYKSAGLWEYGISFLKQRVFALLFQEGFSVLSEDGEIIENLPAGAEYSKGWQRISRVDYAFDFHCEAFTAEMMNKRIGENLVLPSGVKYGTVGTSATQETLTIGMNRKGLQIQVYDKGKEITEKSGKIWMFKVWEKNGFEVPEDGKAKNVWRVELRFGKDFIKDRGILCLEEFIEKSELLLCEAIFKRRLAVPGAAKRERWPLHPLFAECYRATGMVGKYAPIGRQHTLRHEELAKMLDKQIQGTVRSKNVLMNGAYDDQDAQENLVSLGREIAKDREHKNKEAKAQERYKHVKDAI